MNCRPKFTVECSLWLCSNTCSPELMIGYLTALLVFSLFRLGWLQKNLEAFIDITLLNRWCPYLPPHKSPVTPNWKPWILPLFKNPCHSYIHFIKQSRGGGVKYCSQLRLKCFRIIPDIYRPHFPIIINRQETNSVIRCWKIIAHRENHASVHFATQVFWPNVASF